MLNLVLDVPILQGRKYSYSLSALREEGNQCLVSDRPCIVNHERDFLRFESVVGFILSMTTELSRSLSDKDIVPEQERSNGSVRTASRIACESFLVPQHVPELLH